MVSFKSLKSSKINTLSGVKTVTYLASANFLAINKGLRANPGTTYVVLAVSRTS